MAFNPNESKRVTQANTRSSTVDYDLAYSEQTNKFRVSPEMFDVMDLENNGLTLYEDAPQQGQLTLVAEPEKDAVMHRGRKGYSKGREFTASRMRTLLDRFGFKGVNKFTLQEIPAEGDIKAFVIGSEQEGEPLDGSETQGVDYVPTEKEETEKVKSPEPEPEQPSQGHDDNMLSDEPFANRASGGPVQGTPSEQEEDQETEEESVEDEPQVPGPSREELVEDPFGELPDAEEEPEEEIGEWPDDEEDDEPGDDDLDQLLQ